MSNRYDYGNLSRAATRMLKPAVEKLGYRQIKGSTFGREHADWIEGFFLQAGAYGSGNFCVNIGIDVPKLDDLWLTNPSERSFGPIVGGRLGSAGVYGDTWYDAEDTAQLQASIEEVTTNLVEAESWFSKYKSLTDVAKAYKATNNVTKRDDANHMPVISNANYGFLLLLVGRMPEAKEWLNVALQQCQAIVSENEAQFKKRRPGKETLGFHALDLKRLEAVERALRESF